MVVLNDVDEVRLGGQAVDEVYLGANKLWPPPFTPASISGLVLQLDATTLSLSDGNPVTTWADQSVSGFDATTAAGQTQPLYRAGITPNGKPAVEFTTSPGRMLDIRGLGTWLSGRRTYSLIIAMQPRGSFANWPVIMCAPTNTLWQWLVEFDAANGGVYWGHINGRWRMYAANTQLYQWITMAWVLPDGAPQHYYHNGVDPGLQMTSSGGDMWPTVPEGLGPDVRLGAYYAGDLALGAYVAEVLFYDHALPDPERLQIEDYLRTKWGLV